MIKIKEITGKTELVSEGSWGSKELGEHNWSMTFFINESGDYGRIEFDAGDAGFEEIGLWFNDKTLTDYDGVFEIPHQSVTMLKELGYDMSYLG